MAAMLSEEYATGTCALHTAGDHTDVWREGTCATTDATVGMVTSQTFTASTCSASDLADAGSITLVGFCRLHGSSINSDTWQKASKAVIEECKLKTYDWTDNKICSGTGTEKVSSIEEDLVPGTTCGKYGIYWYSMGKMIGGEDLAGYSTVPHDTTTGTTTETTTETTTGTTTGTTTPAPTPSVETVSQAVTISELASSDYTGTLKTDYQKGYGVAVGACTAPCSSYNTGISIASSATDRRAATVTFVMTLTGVSDTSAYTGGCSGTCTSTTLAAKIATATGTTITVSTMATASVTTEAPTSGNTATSAAISVFLGAVCTVLNLMFC